MSLWISEAGGLGALRRCIDQSAIRRQGCLFAFSALRPSADCVRRGAGGARETGRDLLNDDRYLLVSPNGYNGLGVGTTQLYNEPVIYKLKRHGHFKLGGRFHQFRKKPSVPARLTEEVLLVDLLQNLDRLAEDKAQVLPRALRRARDMEPSRLAKAPRDFGSVRAGRLVRQALEAA